MNHLRYTLHELELLRAATEPARRTRRRRRASPRQRLIRGLHRERPQLTVFSLDTDDVTSQLARGGPR